MTLCVESNFDILLTIYKNLQHQQNLDKYPVTIIILNSYTSKLEELVDFIPLFESQLQSFQKHQAYIISR